MKNFLNKYWWVILIVLVIGGWFYWYELRPSQIKKQCFESAYSDQPGFQPGEIVEKYTGVNPYGDEKYKKCLRENGLEK